MTERFEFDHLSIAVRRPLATARQLRAELGAEPLTGGILPQFRYLLMHVGDVSNGHVRGGRLELISTPEDPPEHTAASGFMHRFLAKHGERAHHLSFNVPDLRAARSALHEAGFHTIQEDLDFPGWQEVFLPPDQLHGMLIQIASTPAPIRTEALLGTRERDWSSLPNNRGATDPGWWEPLWNSPPPPHAETGYLGSIVVGTSDLARSDVLFTILRGVPEPVSFPGAVARKYVWPTGSIILVEGEPGVRGAVVTFPGTRTRAAWQIGDVPVADSPEDVTPHGASVPERPATPVFVRRADRVAGVAHVVIDRPEARNAINTEVARQLGAEFDRCDRDPAVRVIVLSGAPLPDGRGTFSAGLDLKAFAASGDIGEIPGRGFAGLAERPPVTPIIAAVEGFALAGGFEIALACDLIVAAADARFGLPEVTRGLVADGGSLLRLPERIPAAIAMELALTGTDVTAETLERLGIVNRVVPGGEAVEGAHELASAIARNAPLALTATKRILSRASRAVDGGAWAEQRAIAEPVWTSDDAREGASAFAERRDPEFRGE